MGQIIETFVIKIPVGFCDFDRRLVIIFPLKWHRSTQPEGKAIAK